MLSFSNRHLLIMYELLHNEYRTSAQLALNVGVSVRTIKSDIPEMRLSLSEFDIELKSKPGLGYTLSANNYGGVSVLENFKRSNIIKKVYRYNKSNSDRVSFVVLKLLESSDYLKVDDIAEELFISRGSVVNDLQDVRQQLARFHLSISSKPSFGIKVIGNEQDFRNALVEFKYNNDLLTERFDNEDYAKDMLKIQVIEDRLRLYFRNFRLSDFSYANLALFFLISYQRVLDNKVVHSINYEPDAFLFKQTKTALSDIFNVEFSEVEVRLLCQHIDYKQIICGVDDLSSKEKLLRLLNDEMYNNFGLDFTNLNVLMDNLYSHITQMVKRSRNGMVIKNPITYNILRDYPFASKLTISVVSIINSIYDIQIGLDEFAFLVLYLETALQNIASKPIVTIGFDSGQSRIESQLFLKEIESRFSDQYTRVIENIDDVDILVSTKRSNDKNFISIQDSSYLQSIESSINGIRNDSIRFERYFNEDSIIVDLEGEDKEAVLENLWLELKYRNLLKDVSFSNDTLIGLEVGHQVLHLQDYGKAFERPIFMIAVLERPIIWDNTVVRVIVLIKTKRDGDSDLHKLSSILSQWLNDTDAIVRMIEKPSINIMSKYIDKSVSLGD